jgi:phosphoribosylglycinamide formyltransferase-1
MAALKLGVLISGRGSNLQSLIDATLAAGYPAEIAVVIANVPGVHGLARAEAAGIPTKVIDHKSYDGRAPFEEALHDALIDADVELVCLAGFMRLLTDGFVDRWSDRLINIHPSLLPAFKGLHTHDRVIEAGVKVAGCTIHFVRPAMDEGPIILQATVPVLQDDDADTLAARILAQEHRIYPLAVRLIADGRVRVDGTRVAITGTTPTEAGFISPCEN